jgi:hypothetical protein
MWRNGIDVPQALQPRVEDSKQGDEHEFARLD